MNRRTGYLAALAAILLLFSTLPSAFAQDDDQDPPGRAGRVSYTSGTVSFVSGAPFHLRGFRFCQTRWKKR